MGTGELRGILLAVVLLGAGLAGCLGAEDSGGPAQDDTEPSPPDEPRELDVPLPQCNAIEAFATADAATAREHVPEDFDLMLSESGQAQVILGGLQCGEDGGAAERGFVAIFVEPQDEALIEEGIENYFWEPEHHLVPGNDATEAFHELGAQATEATSVEVTFAATEVTLAIETGNGTHRASSNVPPVIGGGQAADTPPSFREYSAADGGYVYLKGFTYTDARVGFVPRPSSTDAGTDLRGRGLLVEPSVQIPSMGS